jgi:hypothetical protein
MDNQIQEQYAIATYDASFKYLMSDAQIRDSLISAFLFEGQPPAPSNSQALNGNLNPLLEHQDLRLLIYPVNIYRMD